MSTRELAKLIEELPAEARALVERYAEELQARQSGPATQNAKLALMEEAARDPLYRRDIDEIAADFSAIDSEHL